MPRLDVRFSEMALQGLEALPVSEPQKQALRQLLEWELSRDPWGEARLCEAFDDLAFGVHVKEMGLRIRILFEDRQGVITILSIAPGDLDQEEAERGY